MAVGDKHTSTTTRANETPVMDAAAPPLRDQRFLENQDPYLTHKYEPVPGMRMLGCGGFGDVRICWRVDDHGAFVAIKSMRYSEDEPSNLRMDRALEKEIKHLKLCRHPHILEYLGLTRDDPNGGVGIVCNYAANKSLATFLKERGDADRYKLVREVAAGLAYLHYPSPAILVNNERIHIVHGDIHLGNVLIMADGRAVLGDFGLSKMAREGVAVSRTARVGGADGVPEYLAPEVHRLEELTPDVAAILGPLVAQEKEYAGLRTVKSDVFAFGMLVFTTFRGKDAVVPALGPSAAAAAALIAGRRPQREDVSPPESKKSEGANGAGTVAGDLAVNRPEEVPLDDKTWLLICDCWQDRASKRPAMADVCARLN